MRRARAFTLAVWEFVVGEDWRTAVGVIVALGSTAVLAGAGIPAWWITPVVVIVLLAISLRRAAP